MTICKLCVSIPFDGVGLGPFPGGVVLDPFKYIHEHLQQFSETEPTKYPYHPSLESLKTSSEKCHLCQLVLSSIEKGIEERSNPKHGIGNINIPKQPTWELWLTKRNGTGDGFCVFSNFEDSEDFCFVAAVGVCVQEGDPLDSTFVGRPIEQDPTSPRTVARMMQWVKQCNNEHSSCTAAEPPTLPSRVIDVGDETDGHFIKLRQTEGESGRYISLSHCWGTVTQFTTTKATLETHGTRINFDDLPKTFKDAIELTRVLGIRYLWIDSICICQDDIDDWDRESARMTSVYQSSYLTIAASSAKDSSVGCFLSRQPVEYVRIPFKTEQGISGELQAFSLPLAEEKAPALYVGMAEVDGRKKRDHPLSSRAWAVQERFLTRRTLHFGKHQMYFECIESFRGENGLQVPWGFNAGGWRQNELKEVLKVWNNLLENYGSRSLTKASDKLPAFSGLARLFAEKFEDEYVAGLWKKSLVGGLGWDGAGVRRVSEYRAPSWSWASVDGTPSMRNDDDDWELWAEILDFEVELKGHNIFGEVNMGWIKIRAPLIPLILDPRIDPKGTGHPYENNPRVRTEKGHPDGTHSRFDMKWTGPTGRANAHAMVASLEGVPIFALILSKWKNDGEDGEVTYQSLIVREAADRSNSMQRVGCMLIGSKALGACRQLDHPDERPVITLT